MGRGIRSWKKAAAADETDSFPTLQRTLCPDDRRAKVTEEGLYTTNTLKPRRGGALTAEGRRERKQQDPHREQIELKRWQDTSEAARESLGGGLPSIPCYS